MESLLIYSGMRLWERKIGPSESLKWENQTQRRGRWIKLSELVSGQCKQRHQTSHLHLLVRALSFQCLPGIMLTTMKTLGLFTAVSFARWSPRCPVIQALQACRTRQLGTQLLLISVGVRCLTTCGDLGQNSHWSSALEALQDQACVWTGPQLWCKTAILYILNDV